MGSLGLPAGASVYFDAQIAIYSVEQPKTYAPALDDFWRRVQAFEIVSLTSELSLHKCLVHPLRVKDAARVQAFEGLVSRPNVQRCPVTGSALRRGAQFRADYPRLRAPDSIHAATAVEWQADFFLTNDRAFRGVVGVNVVMLDDHVSPQPTP